MPKYIAMWNMPGCLPEMDPAEFETFEQARDFIADELQGLEDDYLLEALSTDNKIAADDLTVSARRALAFVCGQFGPFAVNGPNGYAYSVELAE